MPAKPHSEAFLRVRNRLLEMDDADRVAIARLFGAMQHAERDLSPRTIEMLRAIFALDDDGVIRMGGWTRAHLNAWGQVPAAASRRSDLRPNRSVVDPPTDDT